MVSPLVQMEVIQPKSVVSIPKLRGFLLQALNAQEYEMKRYLEMTTETFEPRDGQDMKPKFVVNNPQSIRYKYAGGDIILFGEPLKDGSQATKVWHRLNEGTSKRYAVMEKGFVPKTKTGRVRATAGRGTVAYYDPFNPRPGIKARRWTYFIPRLMKARFARAINEAIRKGTS